MEIIFIFIFVFLSVYIITYQIYLRKLIYVPLEIDENAVPGKHPAPKQKVKLGLRSLHKFSRLLSFLAKPKLLRSLASRGVPLSLVMAGSSITIVEFIIFKILSIVIFFLIAGIIFRGSQNIFLMLVLFTAVGFFVPDIWLKIKIKKRHHQIRRDLPVVIDLLNLCVGAGLDFMLAVNRVVRDFRKCPLTDELSEVWRETQMGVSRREALQHLSRRVGMVELSSFVRTLLQADRMGSPMNEALRIQAEEIRMRRFLMAEEMALKAPIKLLFPLFFFILPAVLVIVAGPIFLQFMRGGVDLKF